eukprot:jgi/Chrzof1/4597/Cz14g19190.t1
MPLLHRQPAALLIRHAQHIQVLVEAQTTDGALHSIILQNAETVRLVGPTVPQQPQQQQQQQQHHHHHHHQQQRQQQQATLDAPEVDSGQKHMHSQQPNAAGVNRPKSGATSQQPCWCALSVSELQPGDAVYILRQEGARHTGIAIQESITEK